METIDISSLTPDKRKLDDMREVLADKEFAKNSPDMELYYMYRNLKQVPTGQGVLKYNITVITGKMLGEEYAKTAGHYHKGSQMELYNIIEGEGIFLMQKGDGERIEDVYVVAAKAGESAIIKPNYGHVTINPSDKDLKTQDWSPVQTESDYSMFKNLRGACYYYTKDGWVKNPNYKEVPEIRFEEAVQGVPEDLSFIK